MKQKYTLSIADMEINVVTDEPQEAVEHIVGMLDRKIREISLKSKRCSKNEAALLCALDFCADKVKCKEQIEELEEELAQANSRAKTASEKLEYVQKHAERLEREKSLMEAENAKLRSLLDDARVGKKAVEETAAAPEAVPVSVAAESVHEMPVGDIYAATADAAAESAEKPAEKAEESAKKKPQKNRVGSMFDLLTFTDI